MHHDGKDGFRFEDSLGLAISKAGKVLAREIDYAARSLKITHVQMGVLLLIARDAAMTLRRIGNLLEVDSATVSRSLDELERQGLISRSRNLYDRRLLNLRLTPEGKDVAARAPDILIKRFNERFKALSKAEYAQLARLLRKCMVD